MNNNVESRPLQFRLRTFLVGIGVLASLLAGWQLYARLSWSTFEIESSEITEPIVRTVRLDTYATAKVVQIVGYIDGQAVIETHDQIVTVIGPGAVNVTISEDFLSSIATFKYKPKTVTKGKLLIKYKFHYL